MTKKTTKAPTRSDPMHFESPKNITNLPLNGPIAPPAPAKQDLVPPTITTDTPPTTQPIRRYKQYKVACHEGRNDFEYARKSDLLVFKGTIDIGDVGRRYHIRVSSAEKDPLLLDDKPVAEAGASFSNRVFARIKELVDAGKATMVHFDG